MLKSMPRIDDEKHEKLTSIPGQPPNLQHLPQGCNYRPRCPYAFETCDQEEPALHAIGDGRAKACHLESL